MVTYKWIAFLGIIFAPGSVIAGEWTGNHKVEKLYLHGDNSGLYVQIEASAIDPDECSDSTDDWYFISRNNSMQDQIFGLLLAAKKTDSSVNLYIDGCAQGKPTIMAAKEE